MPPRSSARKRSRELRGQQNVLSFFEQKQQQEQAPEPRAANGAEIDLVSQAANSKDEKATTTAEAENENVPMPGSLRRLLTQPDLQKQASKEAAEPPRKKPRHIQRSGGVPPLPPSQEGGFHHFLQSDGDEVLVEDTVKENEDAESMHLDVSKIAHRQTANKATAAYPSMHLNTPAPVLADQSQPLPAYNSVPVQKEFRDPVHGQIELPEACVRVIDTPEFQRLRQLRQLGIASFVFPGATHTRFEHSLGVAHLARRLCRLLRDKQGSQLKITESDELCVVLAGLCHDIGHGPFSHLFDNVVVPHFKTLLSNSNNNSLHKNNGSVVVSAFRHEDASADIVRRVFRRIGMDQFGLTPTDELFVLEMIRGTPPAERRGRPPMKHYLYDIINNSDSGLDVDKLDYFQRDCHHCGVTAAVDFERLLCTARVHRCVNTVGDSDQADTDAPETAPLRIAFPNKTVEQVHAVFSTRFFLHRTLYQHKVSKAVEFMMRDALILANDHLVRASDDNPKQLFTLAESVADMSAYVKFTDSVLDEIVNSHKPELQPARELILRIYRRQLYKMVGHQVLSEFVYKFMSHDGQKSDLDFENDIANEIVAHSRLQKDDIIVELQRLHHGKKDQNPIGSVYFFRKRHSDDVRKPAHLIDCESFCSVWPTQFQELRLRVFVKNTSHFDEARAAFRDWCHNNEPKYSEITLSQQVPM